MKEKSEVIERSLFEKKQRQECVGKKDQVLKKHSAAFARLQKRRVQLEYLYRYFDVINDGTSGKKNLGEVVISFEQLVRQFMSLVFPHRDEDNFFLLSTPRTTAAFFDFYTNPPAEVVQYVGSVAGEEGVEALNETRGRNEIYGDIDLWINGLLLRWMRCIHEQVYASGFFDSFDSNVRKWLIGGWACLISKNSVTGRPCVENIEPFSLAEERNNLKEVVGIYRELRIRRADVETYYPDYDGQLPDGNDDEELLSFKECLLRRTGRKKDGSAFVFWWYCVFDFKQDLVVFRVLDEPGYMIFADRIFSDGGSCGRLFYLYDSIFLANRQQQWLNDNLASTVEPPRTINVDLLAPIPGVVSREGYRKVISCIKNGDVIPVTGHGLVADIPPPRPDLLIQNLITLKTFICRAISGELLNMSPDTTATLSRIQDNLRSQFVQSLGSSAVEDFMWQLVRVYSSLLRQNGTFESELFDYMRLPDVKMPMWFLQLKTFVQDFFITEGDTESAAKGMEILNWALRYIVTSVLDIVGDFSGFKLKVAAPVEIIKSSEKAQVTLQAFAQMSQFLQTSPFEFIDIDKFLGYYAKALGVDTDLLLTKQQRLDLLEKRAQAQAQAQIQGTSEREAV